MSVTCRQLQCVLTLYSCPADLPLCRSQLGEDRASRRLESELELLRQRLAELQTPADAAPQQDSTEPVRPAVQQGSTMVLETRQLDCSFSSFVTQVVWYKSSPFGYVPDSSPATRPPGVCRRSGGAIVTLCFRGRPPGVCAGSAFGDDVTGAAAATAGRTRREGGSAAQRWVGHRWRSDRPVPLQRTAETESGLQLGSCVYIKRYLLPDHSGLSRFYHR